MMVEDETAEPGLVILPESPLGKFKPRRTGPNSSPRSRHGHHLVEVEVALGWFIYCLEEDEFPFVQLFSHVFYKAWINIKYHSIIVRDSVAWRGRGYWV